MTTKCQACRTNDRVWTWQPFGPDETTLCFTTLGSHYRGFPAIGICDTCRTRVINGRPALLFTYKNTNYFSLNGEIKEGPF